MLVKATGAEELARGILKGLRTGRDSVGAQLSTAAPGSSETERMLALMTQYEATGLGWFWETDGSGNIIYLSPKIAELFGKPAEAFTGTAFLSLFTTNQPVDGSNRSLPLLMGGRKTFLSLTVCGAAAGQELYWSLSGSPKFAQDGEFAGYRARRGHLRKPKGSTRNVAPGGIRLTDRAVQSPTDAAQD